MTVAPTLVILAAGIGSRYGGLKQLAPVGPNGEALLEYSVYDAVRSGFGRVILVVRAETEAAFRARFDGSMADAVSLSYAHQRLDDLPPALIGDVELVNRTKPWGTGQAVLAAAADLNNSFCVINADDFYGADAFTKVSRFLSNPPKEPMPAAAVVGFPVAQTLSEAGPVSRALCQSDDRRQLQEIVEIKKVWKQGAKIVYRDAQGAQQSLRGEELVSMNMWGFPAAALSQLQTCFERFLSLSRDLPDAEFLLPDAVQTIVQGRRMSVEVLSGVGPWCGITFPEDEVKTATLLKAWIADGRYPNRLWSN